MTVSIMPEIISGKEFYNLEHRHFRTQRLLIEGRMYVCCWGLGLPCELTCGEGVHEERPPRTMISAGSSDDSYQCFQL